MFARVFDISKIDTGFGPNIVIIVDIFAGKLSDAFWKNTPYVV